MNKGLSTAPRQSDGFGSVVTEPARELVESVGGADPVVERSVLCTEDGLRKGSPDVDARGGFVPFG